MTPREREVIDLIAEGKSHAAADAPRRRTILPHRLGRTLDSPHPDTLRSAT
jgi:hypothetical protein